MVGFRSHILKAVISTDSVEDPKSGIITPGTETTIEFPCRISPNSNSQSGGGKEIKGQDGVMVVYSYLIHASKNTPLLPFGTMVTVYENGIEKASGKSINAFTNSLNMRIWI